MLFQSGFILFNSRKILSGNNIDTIIKYHPFNPNPVINYNYSIITLEIPLFLGFRVKRVTLSGGIKFIPIIFNNTKTELLNGDRQNYYELSNAFNRRISYAFFYSSRYFIPAVKASYFIKIKKHTVYCFIASNMRTLRFYDFETGV